MVSLCNHCYTAVTSWWCGDVAFRIYLIAFSLTILDGFWTVDNAVWSVLQIICGGIDSTLLCRSEILLKKLSVRVRVLLKFVDQDGYVASGFLINRSSLCFFIYSFICLSEAVCSWSHLFGYLFLFVLAFLNSLVHIPFLQYCTVQGFVLYPVLFILYFTEYERSSGCLEDHSSLQG
jgi:hypothetical protein